MRMANFIVKDAIVPELAATTRDEAICELVASLVAAGRLPGSDSDDVVKAILRRETLGTTGIGHHIAIPHARHPSVEQMIGTLAISKVGLPFESIDGEPVYVVVMLISPHPNPRPGDHLRALENVVTVMRDESYVNALRAATTKDDIWKLIEGGAAA